MKKTKKIIYILIVLLIGLSFLYVKQRKTLNEDLNDVLATINIEIKKPLYNEEFVNKVNNIRGEYKLRTNSSIKNLIDALYIDINEEKCYKSRFYQMDENKIQREVNNFLEKSDDFGVGKIFIYTDRNYGDFLVKEFGYVDCSIYAYGLNDSLIIDNESKIKIRGNSTALAKKKPYNIKFSEKVDLYGFGEAKKWSLLAEYYDPTMLRNRIFLDFAKEMGLEYTSNCEYVEVWVDGKYNGCYLLTESIETGKNRVDIDVEKGDFLFEYEIRTEDDVVYVDTDNQWRFSLSDPENPDSENLNRISGLINDFDHIVYSGNYELVKSKLNIESFAKVFVLNQYAKTVDFGSSSVNFYYKDDIFYAGPVWDFDLSSGNASQQTYPDYWIDNNNVLISYEGLNNWENSNKVFDELYKYDEFKELVSIIFGEYSYYMQGIYKTNGTIDSLLDKYGELIKNNYNSIDSNGSGWSYAPLPFTNEILYTEYESYISDLKIWLLNRYDYLEKEFNK